MDLITVSGISLQEAGNRILSNISFKLKASGKMAIAGETGAGKSTLLQVIAGLVQPGSGDVFFKGRRVKGPQEVLVPGEPGIAYLSQQFELPRFLRVEQVLQYADKLPAGEAADLFKLCRISHLLKRKTDQLSGGERQRIALAKLLLTAPEVLLLDEPFSNLDMGHKNLLKTVIHDIGRQLNLTIILISHDPLDTLSWADKILVLKEGKPVQKGNPEQLYRKPKNEYVAALFGKYNLIPAAKISLFTEFQKENLTGKNLLIRPENLLLTNESESSIPGLIKSVNFLGSYYEVSIVTYGLNLVLRTTDTNLKKGGRIFFTIQPDTGWFV